MDKGIHYKARDLTVWTYRESEPWLHNVIVTFFNIAWASVISIFETHDFRIEAALKWSNVDVMEIIHAKKIKDLACLNWIEWRLIEIPKTERGPKESKLEEALFRRSEQESLSTKIHQTIEITIRSWVASGLNRWDYLSPVRFNYGWESGIFSFNEVVENPFSLWSAELEILWKDTNWNMLAKLEWINWVVTGSILDIIKID